MFKALGITIGTVAVLLTLARAQDTGPDVAITLSERSVGGVGVSYGLGVLTSEGCDYPFQLSGF